MKRPGVVELAVTVGVAACAAWLGGWRATGAVVLVIGWQLPGARRGPWEAAFALVWLSLALAEPVFWPLIDDVFRTRAELPRATALVFAMSDALATPRALLVGAVALALRRPVARDCPYTEPAVIVAVGAWLAFVVIALCLPLATRVGPG